MIHLDKNVLNFCDIINGLQFQFNSRNINLEQESLQLVKLLT